MSEMWNREPFFGGVEYHHPKLGTVTGWYDSPKFENECDCWEARRGGFYPTFEAAAAALAAPDAGKPRGKVAPFIQAQPD